MFQIFSKDDLNFFKKFQKNSQIFIKFHKFSQIFKFFENFLKNFMLCYTKIIFLLYNVSLTKSKQKEVHYERKIQLWRKPPKQRQMPC